MSLHDRCAILKTHPQFENIFAHKELLQLSSLMYGERTSKFLQDVFSTNSNLMDVHIKNIRRKIGRTNCPCLLSLRGILVSGD